MPDWLQAIVLGVVQGLTEFFPVSSDGHLVLATSLFGLDDPGLAFDVALHMGTFLAVVVYFRRELVVVAGGLLGRDTSADGRLYRRVGLLVVPASVPVALTGLFVKGAVEGGLRSPVWAAVFLFVTATVLVAGERIRDRRTAAVPALAPMASTSPSEREPGAVGFGGSEPATQLPVGADLADPAGRDLRQLTVRDAVLMGVAQVFALLPGVSRSGSTISAGVACGLTREAATRFSFLMALPALVGAFAVSMPDLGGAGAQPAGVVALGVLAAFASGYVAIRLLVRLVARSRLTGFAVYCAGAATVALAVTLGR